ncbi:hypothetical protein [Streptomyces sp. NPDC091209]
MRIATPQIDHLGEDVPELLQITAAAGDDQEPHCADTHGPVHRPDPHD